MTKDQLIARIENDFTYHPPTSEQILRYAQIRDKYRELALLLIELTPQSREQSMAFSDLDHSCMMANASIARNEKNG